MIGLSPENSHHRPLTRSPYVFQRNKSRSSRSPYRCINRWKQKIAHIPSRRRDPFRSSKGPRWRLFVFRQRHAIEVLRTLTRFCDTTHITARRFLSYYDRSFLVSYHPDGTLGRFARRLLCPARTRKPSASERPSGRRGRGFHDQMHL